MSGQGRLAPLSYAVRLRVVGRFLGEVLVAVAGLSLVPLGVALAVGDLGFALRLGACIAVLAAAGAPLMRLRFRGHIQTNEALAVIGLAFLVTPLALAWPFAGAGLAPLDAVFEAVSGVTTTGLSMVPAPEAQSPAFLFARSWMQWYGGLGIVVFSVVILLSDPGAAARRFVASEPGEDDPVTGARTQARQVLKVYLLLTGLGVALLWGLGVGPFAALIHSLSGVSTGGFSTHSESLAALGPWPAQLAVMAIAVTGAISLPLYLRAWRRGWRELGASLELRALGAALLGVILLLAWLLAGAGPEGLGHAVLMGLSAQTGTGYFSVAPADLAPAVLLVLLLAMVVGGAVGSTTGGVKLFRVLVLLRLLQLQLQRTRLPPHAVAEPRLAGEVLEARQIERALVVVLLMVLVVALAWLPFLVAGHAPMAALFEVVSATATVGLSTGITGPELEPGLKLVLIAAMLLGRVEFVALLVVLYPGTWLGRRNRAE